jgi:hypothetical protein
MFRPRVVVAVAFAMVVLFSVKGWGQFQEPTKEELQMTADSKAPDAQAVYLYFEDVQDDERSTRTYYERLKVLTEKGKGKATVRFTHTPDTKFEVVGRTIQKDGTIVPMKNKPSDLVDFKTKGLQVNSLVFTLPSVEVGSILEYRVRFFYSNFVPYPTWMVQQDVFMQKAHYAYKRQPGRVVTFSARVGDKLKVVDSKNVDTLDAEDISPLPDEDWMPPSNTFKLRVSFFNTRFGTAQAYWDWAGSIWSEVVRGFINPTGTLRDAVAQIVGPGDSETIKAQKIYAAVMKLENSDFTREKTKAERKKEKIHDINNAQDVWRDQSGTGDEIALLYVALCRAAGLNVVPMKLVDRSQALFDEAVLNGGQMNDYIAVAELDGKEYYLDPGEKMCPFGLLHWKHTMTTGFRLADKIAKLDHTPPPSYKTANLVRVADLKIDPTGNAQGTIQCLLQGQEALRWRQLALENDPDEVKRKFDEWMQESLPEGVQENFDHFVGLEDSSSNLMAFVKVNGTLGTLTGKRLFLPGLFFEAKSKHPFVAQDKREMPVDVHYARAVQDQVIYEMPPGYAMESGPKTAEIKWAQQAVLNIAAGADESKVDIRRTLIYGYTYLAPKDYGDLHDFYQKVAEADQQQLILARSTPKAGN